MDRRQRRAQLMADLRQEFVPRDLGLLQFGDVRLDHDHAAVLRAPLGRHQPFLVARVNSGRAIRPPAPRETIPDVGFRRNKNGTVARVEAGPYERLEMRARHYEFFDGRMHFAIGAIGEDKCVVGIEERKAIIDAVDGVGQDRCCVSG